jgi:hypothetical protein
MDGGLDAEGLLERRVLFRDIVLGSVVDVILDTLARAGADRAPAAGRAAQVARGLTLEQDALGRAV